MSESVDQGKVRVFVTVPEAAYRLSMSKRTLERERAADIFPPFVRIGRRGVRVPVDAINLYVRVKAIQAMGGHATWQSLSES